MFLTQDTEDQTPNPNKLSRRGSIIRKLLFIFLVLYGILLIPDSNEQSFQTAERKPFLWNRDSLWHTLQDNFVTFRHWPANRCDSMATSYQIRLDSSLNLLVHADSASFASLAGTFLNICFESAPIVATSSKNAWFPQIINRARALIKEKIRPFDLNQSEQRSMAYSLLYGLRAVLEEVILQSDTLPRWSLQYICKEPSYTPSALIRGIEIHSGDLIVSRGAVQVSAFISRGNDYPGNFSHVALAYVSPEGTPQFIEAHIEKGVALSTLDEYLDDPKMRFMVLRPRSDLPAIRDNPVLPHTAAGFMKKDLKHRFIPYDFQMDFFDSSAMFCSEVGSYAYRKNGIQLWKASSTISSPGIAGWMHSFGVEHFVTQMPSDLEYDPQLSIVAEWYNTESLFKDHLDNAVMDALYERADAGVKLEYTVWMLPVARFLKGISVLQNIFGGAGIIPRGMTATQALKNKYFMEWHKQSVQRTMECAEAFKRQNGFRPPYWQLLAIARETVQR